MQKNKQYWLVNLSCIAVLATMFIVQKNGGIHAGNNHHISLQSLSGQVATTSTFCTEMSGYWKLDDGTGVIATDASGNDNHAEFVDMTATSWSEDVADGIDFWNTGSLELPGTGYIWVETGSNVKLDDDVTISLWVNYELLSSAQDGNVLVSFAGDVVETGTENDDDNYLYSFSINGSSKKLRMMWENGSSATDVVLESSLPADINASEWNHLVVTRNANQKKVSFYNNGTLVGSALDYTLVPSGNSGSSSLYIGVGPHSPSTTHFNGLIDDVRIYEKSLTAAQVYTIYAGADSLLGCTCGNNEIEPPEECDDGNSSNTDSCTTTCTDAICGDGYVQSGEECDPPGTATCSSTCQSISSSAASSASSARSIPPNCGNRIVNEDEGEECDAGHLNGSGECSEYCTLLFCGDGIVSAEVNEECEPTPTSYVNGEPVYTEATCGNTCGIPDSGNTACKRQFLPPCEAQSTSASSASSSAENTESSEATKPAAPEQADCGNGTLDETEQCDDGGVCTGGSADGSSVRTAEEVANCIAGGGISIAVADDGCSASCAVEFCGDGVVQAAGEDAKAGTADDEQCDNGSVCSNDASVQCSADEECQVTELCEENANGENTCGGNVDGASCATDADCTRFGRCIYNYELDTNCTNACTLLVVSSNSSNGASQTSLGLFAISSTNANTNAVCGNFIVESGEECDEGTLNSDTTPNACRTDCTAAVCGDGVTDGTEECDEGGINSDTKPDACRTTCKLPVCGDGVRDSGEDCDGGPTCKKDCTFPSLSVCGNGIVEGSEKCDDGNIWPGDGCNSTCGIEPKITSSSSIKTVSTSVQSSEGMVAGVQSIFSSKASSSLSSAQSITVSRGSASSFSTFTLQPIQYQAVEVQNQYTANVVQPTHSPVGDTGPATVLVVATGAASGVLWKRRKKKAY